MRRVIAVELYTTLQKVKFSVVQKYFVNHIFVNFEFDFLLFFYYNEIFETMILVTDS